MSLYHTFSFIKVSAAIIILLSLYFTIDPYADPLIAISGGMVGFFLLARGCSFFFFQGRNTYIQKSTLSEEKSIIKSYKLSLLFGIYILFNLIFLLQEKWTILGGIVLLVSFILIQGILLPSGDKQNE